MLDDSPNKKFIIEDESSKKGGVLVSEVGSEKASEEEFSRKVSEDEARRIGSRKAFGFCYMSEVASDGIVWGFEWFARNFGKAILEVCTFRKLKYTQKFS